MILNKINITAATKTQNSSTTVVCYIYRIIYKYNDGDDINDERKIIVREYKDDARLSVDVVGDGIPNPSGVILNLGIDIWKARSGTARTEGRHADQLPNAVGPTTLQWTAGVTLKYILP